MRGDKRPAESADFQEIRAGKDGRRIQAEALSSERGQQSESSSVSPVCINVKVNDSFQDLEHRAAQKVRRRFEQEPI